MSELTSPLPLTVKEWKFLVKLIDFDPQLEPEAKGIQSKLKNVFFVYIEFEDREPHSMHHDRGDALSEALSVAFGRGKRVCVRNGADGCVFGFQLLQSKVDDLWEELLA